MNSYNQLPENFTPGDHDVVIGKGKKYFFHKGNAMLRGLAASMLNEYALAKTKLDKSLIISDVAEHVRQKGNFVKRDNATERWVIAEDLLCREKISAVFRDALHQRQRTGGSSFTKRTEEKRRTLVQPQVPFQWKIKVPPPTFGLHAQNSFTTNSDQLRQAPLLAAANANAVAASQASLLGVASAQGMMAGPLMAAAAAPGAGDIFSIFSNALANIKEEGDPFEPKPLIGENSSTSPPATADATKSDPHCLSPGSRAA